MVTVTAGLAIDLNDQDEGTTSIGFRRAIAVLFRQANPGVAIPGRLGADNFAVSGAPSSMAYTVTGGGLVLVRTASGGAYLVGMPSSVVVPTAPADGVNPRIDRIYAKQPDPPIDGGAVQTEFIIDVVSGNPAASPLVPALPAGAYELSRKMIAAGATNTQAGAAFTNVAPVTGLNVGMIPLSQGGTGAATKQAAKANFGFTIGTADANAAQMDEGDIHFKVV